MVYEFEMTSERIPMRKEIMEKIDGLLKEKVVQSENFEWERTEEVPYS